MKIANLLQNLQQGNKQTKLDKKYDNLKNSLNSIKERVEHIINKFSNKTMMKEKSKYESLSFIQDEWIKWNGICKEIESIISEMIKDKQIDYIIQDLMNKDKFIQFDEEYKAWPYIEVPDEIYDKEYKMIDMQSQSSSLIEKVEKKIKITTKNAKENEEVNQFNLII